MFHHILDVAFLQTNPVVLAIIIIISLLIDAAVTHRTLIHLMTTLTLVPAPLTHRLLLPEIPDTAERLPVMPDDLLLIFLVVEMMALARNYRIPHVSLIFLYLILV